MPNITCADIADALATYDRGYHNGKGSAPPPEPYIEQLRKFIGDGGDKELSIEELLAVIGILSKISVIQASDQAERVKRSLFSKMSNLARALLIVADKATLDQQIYDLLAACNNHSHAANIYVLLKDANLLNAKNWELVKNHPKSAVHVDTDYSPMLVALNNLSNDKHLNQETFNYCITHDDPQNVAELCWALASNGLLNKENYLAIINLSHPNFAELVHTLVNINHDHLLTQDYIDTVKTHGLHIAFIFALLSSKNLLTAENKAAIINDDAPQILAHCLKMLNKYHIFTEENVRKALHFTSLLKKTEQLLLPNGENKNREFFLLRRRFSVFEHQGEPLGISLNMEPDAPPLTQTDFNRFCEQSQKIYDGTIRATTKKAYTIGATVGMFADLVPPEVATMIAENLSRKDGGRIAQTTRKAADTAKREERTKIIQAEQEEKTPPKPK